MSHTSTPPLLLLLAVPCWCAAQQRQLDTGDECIAQARVSEAIVHYEQAAKAGAPDSLVADRLAQCYLDMRQLDAAERWLTRTAALPQASSRTLLALANAQRALGKLEEADRTTQRYVAIAPAAQRERWTGVDATTLRKLKDGKGCRCKVQGVSINSPGTELSPGLHNGQLVFASDRSGGRSDTWNDAPYLDLFMAQLDAPGQVRDPEPLHALNTRYHESNATFSKDGKEVWFDRNNFHQGRRGRNNKGVMEMRIYGRTSAGGAWSDEAPFAFNGDQGSSCHPSLSPAGDVLFFASDRPGGHGGSDIWYTLRSAQGTWQAPVCMGPEVNTEGDEMFPHLNAQGDFYFSSDGHPGFGGLDILRCRLDDPASPGKAVNPGAPLNSTADDFGLVMTGDGASGYFVSNRAGGAGGDDIYHSSFPEPVVGAMGIVRDRLSAVLLPGTHVVLADDKGNALDSSRVDSTGNYRMAMRRGREQQLIFSLPGYRTLSFPVETPPDDDTLFHIDPPMAFLRTVGLWMHVTDSHTNEGIPGAEVIVIDVAGGNTTLVKELTDANGDHRSPIKDVSIKDSLVYRVKLHREGYYPKKGLFLYVVPDSGEIAMHHEMDISMDPIIVGADAGKSLDLAPIRFATGKWDILPEAAVELDKVVELLKENPTMTIELRGHTDSRGTAAANRTLSTRRSQSAADYIIGSGIYADRIRSRGFGEGALLNRCTDGVKCAELDHAVNRRTEFIVLGR